MDKLDAVRLAAIRLDQARDNEFKAEQTHRIAKDRLAEARRIHKAAMDVLHNDKHNEKGAARAGIPSRPGVRLCEPDYCS